MTKLKKDGALKGSALDAIEHNSISDTEIRHYLPEVLILTYPELKNYMDIKQLLPKVGDFFILLYLDSVDSGHWATLKRFKDGISYFCSYGTPIDKQLTEWYTPEIRQRMGETVPYLTNLLKKTDLNVFYNDVRYQTNKDYDIVTCGRHCLSFILSGKNLKQYFKMMEKLKNQTGESYDDIVSRNINVILD
jgi:hypothetical protein